MMYLLILYVFLTACSSNNESASPSTQWIVIKSRNEGTDLHRIPTYRAKTPSHWIRQTPSELESLVDTTKAIDEFAIDDGSNMIRIVVHNFPTNRLEDRIPPNAQIARWKRQFDMIDPSDIVVIPQSHGGFSGLFFSGIGTKENTPYAILGWSMQLAPEHYRTLQQHDDEPFYQQTSADFTIKAMGQPDSMHRHKDDIVNFADSFELIQEIPAPL